MLDIFLEALWDISIVPLGHQNSFYGVLGFQPERVTVAVVAATAGAALACIANWCLGRLIGAHLHATYAASARFLQVKNSAKLYYWPLLLLTWAPLGGVLPLIFAALGYPLLRTWALCTFAMAGFYIYQSLNVA